MAMRGFAFLFEERTGCDDDGQIAGERVFAYLAQDLPAVQFWKANVHNYHAGKRFDGAVAASPAREKKIQGAGTVGHGMHFVQYVVPLEQELQQMRIRLVVFDDQHFKWLQHNGFSRPGLDTQE